MNRSNRRRTVVVIALCCLLGIGLWQARPNDSGGALPPLDEQKRELAGAPQPLAELHSQASRLLEGSLRSRLRSLSGYPVVVNKWASWCGPCRAELPVIGRVALDTGEKVAFIGLNSEDPNRGSATRLLGQFPQSYPSYRDPKGRQASSLGAGSFFPTTTFLDERGRVKYLHQGPYDSESALRADMARYLGVER